jgi:hypothetical protein
MIKSEERFFLLSAYSKAPASGIRVPLQLVSNHSIAVNLLEPLELSSRTFMYIYYLEAYLSRNRWTSFLASELAVVNSKIEAEM